MPKIYKEQNVYDACIERLEFAFNEFDHVYFSVSAGKDSSVMIQMAVQVAKRLNKKFSFLFIDFEAQYQYTIDHLEELIEICEPFLDEAFWVCLPILERNAVSALQPEWIIWNKAEKDIWVREMPENKYVVNIDNNVFDFWEEEMIFEDFIILFGDWFQKRKGGIVGCGIGIRSNESLNRFRTIVNKNKNIFKGKQWTTQVKIKKPINVFNFYPIYDWVTEDVWGCVSKFNFKYNQVYELMYKNGLSIHQARLCQPYGDDQKNGLDQFKTIEPETWEKLLNRVNGVNFGNIYSRTSLLGHLKQCKPDHLTYHQYAIFLLESLGIYAPEIMDHYYRKIKYYLKWCEKNLGILINNVKDSRKDTDSGVSWQEVVTAIEKNDYWLRHLSFAETSSDKKRLKELKKKYKLFGDGKIPKSLQKIKENMERENDN